MSDFLIDGNCSNEGNDDDNVNDDDNDVGGSDGSCMKYTVVSLTKYIITTYISIRNQCDQIWQN